MMFSDAYCMMSRPVVVSPVNAISRIRGQRLAGLQAESVDDVEHAGRQQVLHQFREHQQRHRRLFRRLDHDRVARRQCRREFPSRHQNRKIPRNDLADDAERLMVMVGDGVVVEFTQRTFLRAHATREVAEVVHRERQVGRIGFADGLAVVVGLHRREERQVLLHAVGDLVEHLRPFCHRRAPPLVRGSVRGIDGTLHILRLRSRDLTDDLPGGRADIVEITPLGGGDPFAADEVLVPSPQRQLFFQLGHVGGERVAGMQRAGGLRRAGLYLGIHGNFSWFLMFNSGGPLALSTPPPHRYLKPRMHRLLRSMP
jgi:ParB family chromosome partitioning protein